MFVFENLNYFEIGVMRREQPGRHKN